MTTIELISAFISFLALLVSVITAYRTLYARFRGEVFLKPRIAITHFNDAPSLVAGFEASNLGAKSGTIDDLVLIVQYRQKNPKGINNLLFLPYLSREDYSVFEEYRETDFEPFQSIIIPGNSSATRYIVFSPLDASFSPSECELELQLWSRSCNESKWKKAKGSATVVIDEDFANIWRTPESKRESIWLESGENVRLREEFMDKIFSTGR